MIKKLLLLFSASILFLNTNGQWPSSTTTNVPICTATKSQNNPCVISDGAEGAIIAWDDYRSTITNADIYVQRVNYNGNTVWTSNGVTICTASNIQSKPVIVTDGSGGAIIAWEDSRSSSNKNIYAQRIDANGNTQWANDGVAICSATNEQLNVMMTDDGNGGAFIIWEDKRTGTADIYAQRIDASGTVQWVANGIAVCTATSYQNLSSAYTITDASAIIKDGSGGILIVWADNRNSSNGLDIYAQRINSDGSIHWAMDGVPVCSAIHDQQYPALISDDNGGAIITWQDERPGIDTSDIYAQRINAVGTPQWALDGIAVCTAINMQNGPLIVSDLAGGAIIGWTDYRTPPNGNDDVYVQRINSDGAAQWIVDGVVICNTTQRGVLTTIISDGGGGAIMAWGDGRNNYNFDVYTAKVNNNGVPQWTTNGVAVCTEIYYFQQSPQLVSDGEGGGIMVWEDSRYGPFGNPVPDIFAQNICPAGNLGICLTVSINEDKNNDLAIYPNPANNILTIETYNAKAIYQLQDVTGKLLLSGSVTTTKFDLDISALSKGIYLLSLIDGEQQVNRKVVKE